MRLPAARCALSRTHRNGRPGATGGGNGCLAAPGLPARLSRRLSAHSGYRTSRLPHRSPARGSARATLARHAPRRRRQAGVVDARGRSQTPAPGAPLAPRLRARRPAADRHAGLRRLERGDRPRPGRARSRGAARATCPSLQAASAVGQGLLAGAWQRALASAGGRSAQVLLTADDVRRRTSYLNARATLEALLAWDVVPIVNENDSTATDEITFGDNDALAAQVALLLRARLLVLLTDADGLFTRDPRAHGAELVREVHDRALLDELDLDAASRQRPRLGRHALEGRGGLDGGGRRRRLRDRLGRAARDDRARRGGPRGRHALHRGPPAGLGLEAVAALRQAAGRARVRRRRRAHGAALARREPAAGRASSAWRARSARATPCACARWTARCSRRASWPWAARSCDARRASTRPSPASRRPFIAITWFCTMAVTTDSPSTRARAAARTLATLGRGAKDAALEQIALAIERESAAIVEANAEDLAAARASGQSSALLDRLTLDSRARAGALRRGARRRRAGRSRGPGRDAAGGCPTASTCRRCACRSASCWSSTRRAPT